jgi:hypothetical protein
MTQCQRDMMANKDKSKDLAEAAKECTCVPKGGKRSLLLLSRSFKAAPVCPAPPPAPPIAGPVAGAPACEATYRCDFNQFPQVCANAASAISERAKPTSFVMHTTKNIHDTSMWRDGKELTADSLGTWSERPSSWFNVMAKGGAAPAPPKAGWGLAHCNVEEFPFAAFRAANDHDPVLRLISRDENSRASAHLATFLDRWAAIKDGGRLKALRTRGPTCKWRQLPRTIKALD